MQRGVGDGKQQTVDVLAKPETPSTPLVTNEPWTHSCYLRIKPTNSSALFSRLGLGGLLLLLESVFGFSVLVFAPDGFEFGLGFCLRWTWPSCKLTSHRAAPGLRRALLFCLFRSARIFFFFFLSFSFVFPSVGPGERLPCSRVYFPHRPEDPRHEPLSHTNIVIMPARLFFAFAASSSLSFWLAWQRPSPAPRGLWPLPSLLCSARPGPSRLHAGLQATAFLVTERLDREH